MNPKKIEMNSIIKLKNELERCEQIVTDIPDNDRTPSWDGAIFLYRTSILEKKYIEGKIDVQVKGKEVRDLKKKEISYPVEVVDLINFRGVGGTFFFVIYMMDFDHYKIYYNPLLPLDLEEIFKTIEIKQKYKSIKLIEFPKDLSMIMYIFANFIKDSKKQQSTAQAYSIDSLNLTDFESITFSHDSQFMDYLFKFPKYIYGKIHGFNIEVPLSKVYIESLCNHNVQMQVMIGDNILCERVDIEQNDESIIIRIGIGCEINVKAEKIDFVEKGNLNERIVNLKLLLGLLRGEKLEIGNLYKVSKVNIEGHKQNDIESVLKFYINIKNMLDRLGINKEFELYDVSDDKMRELEIFRKAIMDKKPVLLGDKTKTDKILLLRFQVFNIVIGIFAEKVDDKKYILKNLFDELDFKCSVKNEKMEDLEASVYLVLKKGDFLELSNICYETMLKSLLSVSYSVEYGVHINLLSLEMLLAYDEQVNQDFELVNSVITIDKWLSCKKDDNYNLYMINYLQALKRTRPLEVEENQQLHSMKEAEIRKETLNYPVIAAISVLLMNNADFDYYFNKMSLEEQDNFKKYPIYTLGLKLHLN